MKYNVMVEKDRVKVNINNFLNKDFDIECEYEVKGKETKLINCKEIEEQIRENLQGDSISSNVEEQAITNHTKSMLQGVQFFAICFKKFIEDTERYIN